MTNTNGKELIQPKESFFTSFLATIGWLIMLLGLGAGLYIILIMPLFPNSLAIGLVSIFTGIFLGALVLVIVDNNKTIRRVEWLLLNRK